MSNRISLSNRLSKIASFVEEGDIVADIGADHGYLSMFLAQNITIKVMLLNMVRVLSTN